MDKGVTVEMHCSCNCQMYRSFLGAELREMNPSQLTVSLVRERE